MKRALSFILIFSILSFSGPLPQAGEDASPQPLAVRSFTGKNVSGNFPLAFSVTPGEWRLARAGAPFASGSHSADFVLPFLSEMPAPIRYPRWAVREGWEGNFVIAVEVLPSGEAGRWKIMQSTGYPLLDEVAAKTVRKWRFHPATEKGKFIVSCIQIPIQFELKE